MVERSPSDWQAAGLIPNAHTEDFFKIDIRYFFSWPSALERRARTGCICVNMRPTDHQVVSGSIPAGSGNIISWRLITKYFLRSFPPFRLFKKSSCQFLAKEGAQVLVRRLSLSGKSVVWETYRLDITLIVLTGPLNSKPKYHISVSST